MRIFLTILLNVLIASTVFSQTVTYQRADSIKICQVLHQTNRGTSTLWLARQFIGIPYVAHTLEVNDDERLVVNTRQLDCTTLVETVTALKRCANEGKRSWTDYVKELQKLRYRQGVINGYPSRLHYFSDWIRDKEDMNLVEVIHQPVPPFSAVQKIKVSYTSQHADDYRALKNHSDMLPLIRQQEKNLSGLQVRYIPKQSVRNTKLLRNTIHDGDIIAIVTKKEGLDIAHLGFAVWRKNGLHLLNASMLHKRVIEEPMTLYQYLQKHSTFLGIRIIRIK